MVYIGFQCIRIDWSGLVRGINNNYNNQKVYRAIDFKNN